MIDLGTVRASNRHIIQLRTYDPYPNQGPTVYSYRASDIWRRNYVYTAGDWVVYYPALYSGFYLGPWDPNVNSPPLYNGQTNYSANTYFLISADATFNFGSTLTTLKSGDLIVYNGSTWSRINGDSITYVADESHTSTTTFDTTKWTATSLPPYFNLDPISGALYTTLPYLPIYSRTYTFTLRVIKTDTLHSNTEFVNQDFKLVVRGKIDNPISFVTSTNLGSLTVGYLSELAVVAKHAYTPMTITYSVVDGELPPGLSMAVDGSIVGRIDYGTDPERYNFTVRATDIYQQIIEQDFYITVAEYDGNQYTQIWTRPFFSTANRYTYSVFITDPTIFTPSSIYRTADPNFGVQNDIKLYIEYGLQQIQLSDFVEAMIQGFYNKKVNFGNVKTFTAKNLNGDAVYDVVYVEIVDPLQNSDGEFVTSVTSGIRTIYPNSIGNMRQSLELIEINNATIKTDEYQMPLWMRTPQDLTGVPLGYTLSVTLCYTLPGMGAKIVDNIKDSEFDFNQFNFEFDRLIVENNLTMSGPRYLIFPKTQTGVNIANADVDIQTSFVLGVSGTLTIEDGSPLTII